MDGWLSLALAGFSAAAAAGGAWAAVRIELRYMRRDIDAVRDQVSRLRLNHRL